MRSLLLVAALMGILSSTALAAGPTPQQPPHRSDQPAAFEAANPINYSITALSLPALKAVVTVGDIDGPSGPETLSAVANMKPAVDELVARGVSVKTFYPPNDDWNAIKAAANGAHFFFYGGHGIGDSNTPTNYGGMWFTPNVYVSPAEIKSSLKLAPNAIVMLFACYTAGSGTEVNISSAEAFRRVSQYSEAFFAIGAAGYYSNWTTLGFQTFTRNLFNGLTLGDSFKNYSDYTAATTEIYTHPSYPNISLWLDKDYYGGGYKYDNAFGGLPNLTLQNLFASQTAAQIVASPSPIVELTTPGSAPQVTRVTISSTNQASFTWSASLSGTGAWANLSGTSGVSGGQSTLTLNPSGLPKGTYKGTLRVHANTTSLATPDQDIPITLVVADALFKSYLPSARR